MGQVMERPQALQKLVRLNLRKQLDELDYKRALKAAYEVAPQVEIAKALGLTQPTVHSALKSAKNVADVVGDFESATPLEACQRYAAGLVVREELVRQLVAWPYKPVPEPNEFGEYEESRRGSFHDVVSAEYMGLIDTSIYDEVFERLAAKSS